MGKHFREEKRIAEQRKAEQGMAGQRKAKQNRIWPSGGMG